MHHPERQQLWMVWPEAKLKASVDPKIRDGYFINFIRSYQAGDDCPFLRLDALMDFDPWTQEKHHYNVSRLLPEGWFFAVEAKSNNVVATRCACTTTPGARDQPVPSRWLCSDSTAHRISSSFRDQDLLETGVRSRDVLPRGL